jgi:hypothetical protein
MQQREDSVRTAEGSFGLTVWSPPGGSGPGLVLIQEFLRGYLPARMP